MQVFSNRFFGVALLIVALVIASTNHGASAMSALGTAFAYQGDINVGGSGNTTCDLRFGMWDADSGGSQLGATQEVSNVAVQKGHFSVLLNANGEFGPEAFAGAARWLALATRCPAGSGNYTDLTPRQLLAPAPFAHYATSAPWSGLKDIPTAQGDLAGTYPGLTVQGLQGRALSNTVPQNGDVLTWDGSQWSPKAGDVLPSAFTTNPGNNPTSSLAFLSTTVQLTTKADQRIFAIASKAFGSTASGGASGLNLYMCYRSTLVGSAINPLGSGVKGLSAPQNSRQVYTLSTDFAPGVGTFNVGLCGYTSGSGWNINGDGYTTGFVHS